MTRNWSETFARWARPPSDTEESKAARVAKMVREALRTSPPLAHRDFDVIAVGSYRNNTNVRSGSDVDLAAVLRSAAWLEFPADGSLTREMLRPGTVDYGLVEFRRDLNAALRQSFGGNEVSPGMITVTVDENGGRLPADVTPYLVHRRYTGQRLANGTWASHVGIETRPADAPGRRIVHWPQQHYDEGVAKNLSTNRRFKRVVRILKCLRDEMAQHGTSNARQVAQTTRSCFLEHAVFNVPTNLFNQSEGSYYDDIKSTVGHLFHAARTPSVASGLTEVNKMQLLMRTGESWSAKTLEDFMLAAWQHVAFVSP